MKNNKYRKLDNLGRVTIPIEFRTKYDINEGDSVDFIPENDGFLIRKIDDKCIFCGEKQNLMRYKRKLICPNCRKSLQ